MKNLNTLTLQKPSLRQDTGTTKQHSGMKASLKKPNFQKKYWEFKNEGRSPNLSWKILKTVSKYKFGQWICNLCFNGEVDQ